MLSMDTHLQGLRVRVGVSRVESHDALVALGNIHAHTTAVLYHPSLAFASRVVCRVLAG